MSQRKKRRPFRLIVILSTILNTAIVSTSLFVFPSILRSIQHINTKLKDSKDYCSVTARSNWNSLKYLESIHYASLSTTLDSFGFTRHSKLAKRSPNLIFIEDVDPGAGRRYKEVVSMGVGVHPYRTGVPYRINPSQGSRPSSGNSYEYEGPVLEIPTGYGTGTHRPVSNRDPYSPTNTDAGSWNQAEPVGNPNYPSSSYSGNQGQTPDPNYSYSSNVYSGNRNQEPIENPDPSPNSYSGSGWPRPTGPDPRPVGPGEPPTYTGNGLPGRNPFGPQIQPPRPRPRTDMACCTCHRGFPGPAGDAGPDGLDGQPGVNGVPGESGTPGRYEVIVRFPPQCPCEAEGGPVGGPGNKGPQGEAGRDGEDGVPGQDGIPGGPGPTGALGATGNQGPQGFTGSPGMSRSRTGPPGKDGQPGPRGQRGKTGKNGTPGKDGTDGKKGDPGIPGRQGYIGPRGKDGRPGETGSRGLEGTCTHCPDPRLAPGY